MRYQSLLLTILFTVLFTSCEKKEENEYPACFQYNLKDPTNYTLINSWIFLGIIDTNNVGTCKPESLDEMAINFYDSRFSAQSSCNELFGNYSTSDPDSISIPVIGDTRLFCPLPVTVMEWEGILRKGLLSSTNYEILGNRLQIKTKIGYNLIFRAE